MSGLERYKIPRIIPMSPELIKYLDLENRVNSAEQDDLWSKLSDMEHDWLNARTEKPTTNKEELKWPG